MSISVKFHLVRLFPVQKISGDLNSNNLSAILSTVSCTPTVRVPIESSLIEIMNRTEDEKSPPAYQKSPETFSDS